MWQFLSVNVAHVNVGGDTYLYILKTDTFGPSQMVIKWAVPTGL